MNENGTEIIDAFVRGGLKPFAEEGEQGSPAWLYERVANVTASRFKDVLDRLKNGKPSAKREAYLWEVVIETLTGQPSQHYVTAAMQHGIDNEPAAVMSYEARTGAIVSRPGYRRHPTIERCGGSPDGLVGDDGGIEVKAPFNSANHLACWLTGMPEEHGPQIQGYMWIMGREWWDFVSYDPRLPAPLDLYIVRVLADPAYAANLSAEIGIFLHEADGLLSRIAKRSAGVCA